MRYASGRVTSDLVCIAVFTQCTTHMAEIPASKYEFQPTYIDYLKVEPCHILHMQSHLWPRNLASCLLKTANAIVSEWCFAQDMYQESAPLQRGVDDNEMLAQLELDPAARRELSGQTAGDASSASLPLSSLNLYRGDSSTDSVNDGNASPMSDFDLVSSFRP